MPSSTPAIKASVRPRPDPPQAHIRHALNGYMLGAVGIGAPVRSVAGAGHLAVELVPHEHTVADQIPLLCGHALVVPSDGGQPVGTVRSAVTFISGLP